ncbi:type I restriction endonuclease subunit R [Sinirhodobacter ferrireducens]|uniref:Type I restriction enzyme endonuclease subunit n=1 Tax=Paenirhodobacter ferrireducens TaxID=1215032 RepID=A0A443LB49_9RHOB|nr:type I restriction endonuclease subunit R [Sinirhodobacter ferrireducens]RWR46405.1 type I restriction endonuclease subunit R [Sinirhodobacter ferrireducens]
MTSSPVQSEAQLEAALIERLGDLGWAKVEIPDAAALQANLRAQLQAHNGLQFSDGEFRAVLNHLSKGSTFDKAKTLRDRMALTRDDGSTVYVQFFNGREWCRNRYQVTHQVVQEGSYKTRYDVTLLVNGLPLVQIELKRRGVELKEAFNQINRYHRHSFWAESALFQYVQIFVISNGVNTKYFANNRHQDFKQTFFWADEENAPITRLEAFADAFLEKCFVSKMIAKYVVLHESDQVLMVLRSYQYYAVERILDRVMKGRKNGYIWHTTGSGKTLTSFKASQVIVENPKVAKVVFVVDRADLDYQTTREFNFFSPGSVDGTDNTAALVRQLADPEVKLVVTTIQKLNTAITRERHAAAMEELRDQRIVFVFDECHRSQFGDTHKNIVAFFSKAQMFGFTGTPILKENAIGNLTTAKLFSDCLHRYVITDAIRDENVLRFSVEYWGKLRGKDGAELTDEEVTGLDLKEFFESKKRMDGVVDWIIENHDRKTHNRDFSAIMCCSSVEALTRTYDAFARKKAAGAHNLKVATIFTFAANEEDEDANGLIGEPDVTGGPVNPATQHSRDKLAAYVSDYNAMFGTGNSVKDGNAFYVYYKALAKRMKARDRKDFVPGEGIDILLVVNMFLTGFDAKTCNTLYVDKNLRYHGLIQAFSRTNRTLGSKKSQGNIVCFRNLKEKVDEAIALFSNKDADETILVAPYQDYVDRFNEAAMELLKIVPSPAAVDRLESEDDILAFVRAFRELIRIRNVLTSFTEFNDGDLMLDPQRFEDFKSKYLDVYDRMKEASPDDPKASILDEVDFELELIRRDNINVAYILALLASVAASRDDTEDDDDAAKKTKTVLDLLNSEPRLRSKRELIEEFIASYLPTMKNADQVREGFCDYWAQKREAAFGVICSEERLDPAGFTALLEAYQFSGKRPMTDEIVAIMEEAPGILKRKATAERIISRLADFLETFDEDMGEIDED